jgi:hypothetical protein
MSRRDVAPVVAAFCDDAVRVFLEIEDRELRAVGRLRGHGEKELPAPGQELWPSMRELALRGIDRRQRLGRAAARGHAHQAFHP